MVTSPYGIRDEPKSDNINASVADCEITYPNPLTNFDGDSEFCNPARYSQLHNFGKIIQENVESCYIKIFAPGYEDTLFFSAVSRVGCASNEYIYPGRLYGSALNCLRDGFTCLEVKTPDGATCSENDRDFIDDSFTIVTINSVLRPIPLKAVNPIFDDLNIHVYDDDRKLSFGMTYDMISESNEKSTGIFCATAETVVMAREDAKRKCFDSQSEEWAIRFEGKTYLFHVFCVINHNYNMLVSCKT